MRLDNWFLLITSLSAIVWPVVALGGHLSLRRCRSLVPDRDEALTARHGPRISVVIPARNEETGVEAALRSVLAQRGVDLEVIVVNDHSTDATRRIINELAKGDARLRVLHDPPLREGWLGKANAVAWGARFATGDYILFTDADILHHPGSFAAAVREMEQDQLSLLSLMPRFLWESIWENATAPSFLLATACFLGGPIHEPDSDEAFAIGAFIMVDAEVYRQLGGHEAVRGAMLDDVMLARHFKRRGEHVAFRTAPECLSVRMYRGFRAVFFGAMKSCLTLFGENFWVAVPLALTFAVGSVSVLAAPFLGALTGNTTLLALGLFVYFEVWLSVVLARPIMQTHWLKVACFIAGVPLLFAAALVATFQAVCYGSVLWRGRAVRVGS